MKILGKSLIGYQESTSSEKSFRTFNPISNRENDFDIFCASEEDIELAVQKAITCFTEFSNISGYKRANFLLLIAHKFIVHKQVLVHYYCLESGLPLNRAEIELNRTIHQLKEFAEMISEENWNFSSRELGDDSRKPHPKPTLEKYYKAIGPVVVFGASNFPFAYSTIGGDSASALAAGCPVIVKSHWMHAGTGDIVAQLVSEAALETGMPDGVFSNLNSKGIELGEKLVLHPKIKAVGFTGSFQGGMALHHLAQTRLEPIPVFAEMGSVNPIFLFESAFEEENLVSKITQSISANAGQFCTNPGLIFLIKSEKSKQFIDDLIEELEDLEAQVMLHPEILDKYLKSVKRIEAQNGIKNIVQTKGLEHHKITSNLNLTSFQDFINNEILQEEVFGSHTLIVELENENQVLECVEKLNGQLTISLFANADELKSNRYFFLLCEQKAGRLILNGVPTGVEVCEAMNHGGPFPATTDSRFTAVGKDAIYRFLRPISYQNFSPEMISLLKD